MVVSRRIDDFIGTSDQYIAYLEEKIVFCRQHHLKIGQQCPPVRNVQQPQQTSTACEERVSSGRTQSASAPAIHSQKSPLNIRLWTPYQKQPRENPPWKKMANELIKATPRLSEWESKTSELGISSDAHAITFLISPDFQSHIYLGAPTTQNQSVLLSSSTAISPLERLKAYAQVAAQRHARACATLRFARFSQFLVLSACLVLLKNGAPEEEVLEVVRICVGNDITDRYCMDILGVVRFLNRIIDTLDAHGWSDRASELLLICEKT